MCIRDRIDAVHLRHDLLDLLNGGGVALVDEHDVGQPQAHVAGVVRDGVTGPQGVGHWNRQIAQWLSEETGENFYASMFPGRPLQVTANDYAMDLYNGDTGVVLRRDGRLVAVFDSGSQLREVAAARLADVETMYAATVHKSQGSQATRVTVVLPELDSPLLTRELIYTAATRAQKQLTIIGTPEVIERGMAQRIQRASGLAKRLRMPPPAVPGEVSAGSPG